MVRTALGCSSLTSESVAFATSCDETFPLPVKLLSFDAKLKNEEVLVTWATTSEVSNDYFEVQRSNDGKEFAALGKVNGKGNNNSRTSYSFTDFAPATGINFYRLKQVDFNGNSTVSKIVSVRLVSVADAMLSLSPNPVSDELNIKLDQIVGGDYLLQVFDIYGHQLVNKQVRATSAGLSENITLQGLPQGMYMLTVSGYGIKMSKQVIKH